MVAEKDEQIGELRSEVSQLKELEFMMEGMIDDSDTYERRYTLIFSADCRASTILRREVQRHKWRPPQGKAGAKCDPF